MRVSRLMLVTLRDIPAEAEIKSHQLLLRGCYIKRVTSGIYAYLPLMWKVIKKINNIVKEEMDNIGGLEALLPQLQPSHLWEKSGRWETYTSGEGIMFNLQDRQGREIGLGPTHEEVVTNIASDLISSYKQLPSIIYQIQTKFRDEIRPRFGLMRSREFIMKDAYSFHVDNKSLDLTYKNIAIAYQNIFRRCGLDTVSVDADSGAIGGRASQEFMAIAETGEDLILKSSDLKYAANQEKAVSIPPAPTPLNKELEKCIIDTKDEKNIDQICSSRGFDPSQILKVILFCATLQSGDKQPVLVTIRGDQEVNEIKLFNHLTNILAKNILDISPITESNLKDQSLKSIPIGSIGPDLADSFLEGAKSWRKKFIRVTDKTAADLENFICGANKINKHRQNTSWAEIGVFQNKADIRKAKSGDSSLHNPDIKLEECRGIEVGHIFQLGDKYSQALNATFTTEKGHQENISMGCYGIGISRLAQASVEQNNDQNGIIWPISIAPFEVIVVIANIQDPMQKELGEDSYKILKSKGIDVLLDDRPERAGVKFKDADLIGIPWRLVVGREAESRKVEIVERSSRDTKLMTQEDAVERLLKEILPN